MASVKWHKVQVRGAEVCWPRGCACCAEEASARLAIPNDYSEPSGYWKVPFCEPCLRHARPIARLDGFILSVNGCSMVLTLACLVVRFAQLQLLARRCGIRCACAEPSVRHWRGSRDPIFQFARPDYAARFAACNPTLPLAES